MPELLATLLQLAIDRPTLGIQRQILPIVSIDDNILSMTNRSLLQERYPYRFSETFYCHFEYNDIWPPVLFGYGYLVNLVTFIMALRVARVKREAFAEQGVVSVRVFCILTIVTSLAAVSWFVSLEVDNLFGLFATEALLYLYLPFIVLCIVYIPTVGLNHWLFIML